MAYLRPQRMSDSCMNMCEVWRPPPLPYKTGVDLKVLKTIYADNLAYINYTSCCPGYRYIDGSDISSTTAASTISREVTSTVTELFESEQASTISREVTSTVFFKSEEASTISREVTSTVFFKSEEVANAGLGAGVIIALIVGLLILLAAIIAFVLFVKKKYYNNRQSSWAHCFTKYTTIHCLDYKACKCWPRMNKRPNPTETDIKQINSDGANGQKCIPPEEIKITVLNAEVHRNGRTSMSENATSCGNNQVQVIPSRIVFKGASESGEVQFREDNAIENWGEQVEDDTGSERGEEKLIDDIAIENGGQKVREDSASKNGGEKGREDTAWMKRKQCDKLEQMLTPVENVEADEIDEIQNKGHHKSANDNCLRTLPDLIAYNFLNSNKKNVNTPSTSNIHDVLRHSQGVKSNGLPPLDSQSVKHRISDSQVISPKKKKGLFRKSAPDPTC
ncbi:uncharacterized protein LOC127869326 isoform X11 [Dreissena polymorpha]|uniref:uncharacterized protein LOC127869326 isoform X10 n=1 Tax=Dreissena polymorpha TaxID=45954 RepID=UPI00226446B3|nr:uncharacterized protein LOC127869326 isoform X10 [Dreissena polymorpha]XP_052267766.1 uncharacterized protein LOC127869326 isoform X11 [Dreissena polymorpha]